ncbi:helix-turn-helix domain-containing protein [Bacteroidales bacterium OttesenSCG-928-B11]|nr:helix-turn-helix domain-containing protein [Bacteroidales bacterium OttesenSCG-928-E04]MDL2308809.1 helix-turn-helix domain-containing protein [Bacteroidales bacterium OttesenSCG-928-C03]MDL2312087.1 helix-turn-helix domain-containing protein [Bacteroidales bacterium OttesenSCG-928-B11]MDL2325697.1 helix-turn-helix domain-containing protein [Bacteroidales bacterium OttesenSCG-928-A14]
MKNIHIGSAIKQKVSERSLSIQQFAYLINCDRTTVYDIFKRKSIDTERLIRISQILDFDFINEIYLKHINLSSRKKSVFVAIEVEKESLSKLELPENFIILSQSDI